LKRRALYGSCGGGDDFSLHLLHSLFKGVARVVAALKIDFGLQGAKCAMSSKEALTKKGAKSHTQQLR